jgi:hypothetical protein
LTFHFDAALICAALLLHGLGASALYRLSIMDGGWQSPKSDCCTVGCRLRKHSKPGGFAVRADL